MVVAGVVLLELLPASYSIISSAPKHDEVGLEEPPMSSGNEQVASDATADESLSNDNWASPPKRDSDELGGCGDADLAFAVTPASWALIIVLALAMSGDGASATWRFTNS